MQSASSVIASFAILVLAVSAFVIQPTSKVLKSVDSQCFHSSTSSALSCLSNAQFHVKSANLMSKRFDTKLFVATADETMISQSAGPQKKAKKQNSPDALEVVVIGLSHHNAKVEVREKLAIPETDWNLAANALTEYDSITEAAVLSTCNRFELYLAGQNPYECIRDSIDFLSKRAEGEYFC